MASYYGGCGMCPNCGYDMGGVLVGGARPKKHLRECIEYKTGRTGKKRCARFDYDLACVQKAVGKSGKLRCVEYKRQTVGDVRRKESKLLKRKRVCAEAPRAIGKSGKKRCPKYKPIGSGMEGGRLSKGVRHCTEAKLHSSGRLRCTKYASGAKAKRPLSAYQEYVKQYAAEHGIRYGDAMVDIKHKGLWVKKGSGLYIE